MNWCTVIPSSRKNLATLSREYRALLLALLIWLGVVTVALLPLRWPSIAQLGSAGQANAPVVQEEQLPEWVMVSEICVGRG